MNTRLKPWKKIRTDQKTDLKLFQARWDEMQNPRTGQVMKRLILETQDWVNIVPITSEGKIVIVNQYRFGVDKFTSEIPGGLIDEGENSEMAAVRELREETGYTGGEWIYLGSVEPNPAFHTNLCHHWLARGVEKTVAPRLDPGEDIEVIRLSVEELRKVVEEGNLKHVLALSALSRVPQIWREMLQDFCQK